GEAVGARARRSRAGSAGIPDRGHIAGERRVGMMGSGAATLRATLPLRHHLVPRHEATTALAAAGDLVGFHATDPVSVYLAGWARVRHFEANAMDQALYEDRSLLKILGMRRTMFVVPIELAGVIQPACTDAIAQGQRPR